MIGLEELSRWTPVLLNLDGPSPSIDWCDFTNERFSDPFFDQTVARLTSGPSSRRNVRTGLDALLELDHAPSMEPSGIICHLSRCGSTLASRLLASVPGVVSIVEPGPINTLLQADPARVHDDIQVRVLRLLVRALGRVRSAEDRQLVLKLSCWNVRRASVIERAVPGVPIVWLQRNPIEIVSSLLRQPAGWAQLQNYPSVAQHLFGIDSVALATMDTATFCCHAVQSMLDSAATLGGSVIDYDDLPSAVWEKIAPLFGIAVNHSDIVRMQELSRFNSKELGQIRFAPDSERKRRLSKNVEDLCQNLLDPLYQKLKAGPTRQRSATC